MRMTLRQSRVAVCVALVWSASACTDGAASPPGVAATTEGAPTAPSQPVLGAWHELVYSTTTDSVLLVNGAPEDARSPIPLELWSWDGESWALVAAEPGGPSARNHAAAAYDTDRGVLVVHGGIGPGGEAHAETLEWDGTAWRVIDAPGPGPRSSPAMAYDDVRGVVVLHGGDSDGVVHGDTWEWDGARWSQAAAAGPTLPRWPALFEADPGSGEIVLYGGHQVADPHRPSLADTWLWADGRWTLAEAESPPGLLVNAAGAYDPVRGAVVMVGGSDLGAANGAAWAWADDAWVQLSTDAFPARQGHGMTYDEGRGVFVVTGGVVTPGRSPRHQDVWEWDGDGPATRRAG